MLKSYLFCWEEKKLKNVQIFLNIALFFVIFQIDNKKRQDKDSIFLLSKIFQQMGKSKFKIKVIFIEKMYMQ